MATRKVAIVTGTSSGIGLATSTALLAANYSVLGIDISPAPEALTGDPSFKFLQKNIALPAAAEEIVQAARDAFTGRIDALLNVAGIMDNYQSADTLDDATWDRVIAVNLTGPVRLMGAAVRVMKGQEKVAGARGAIANVASKASLSGAAAGLAYTSSKAGLMGATKNVAFRFRMEGIRCNAVCPGAVATNITQSMAQNKTDVDAFMQIKPFLDATHGPELYMQPEQIASMLVYLVSDQSTAVNGSIIPVDNGWSTV